MSKQLRDALIAFRQRLERQGQLRREAHLQEVRDEGDGMGANLNGFQTAGDVAALLTFLREAVRRDIAAYPKPMEFGLPDDPTPPPPAPAEGEEAAAAAPAPAGASLPRSGFAFTLAQQLAPYLQPTEGHADYATLPPGARHYMNLVADEMAYLGSEEAVAAGTKAATFIPKLKNVQNAFMNQRYSDVATILRNALKNEAHSASLLFLLSQFQYFMASNGHQDALPEARDMAQKAMTFSERVLPYKLLQYRYLGATAEFPHDETRSVSWMREHGLLHAAPFQSPEGLAAAGGIPLKAWVLLTFTDPRCWGEEEMAQLKTFTFDIVGGSAIYLGLIRARLTESPEGRQAHGPAIGELETALQQAYRNYQDISLHLANLPASSSKLTWLARTRYMNTLATAAPKPSFDHVLLNVALNGEHWHSGAYPDPEVRMALHSNTLDYWRLWALSITPERERMQRHLLPAAEAVEDAALLADCDGLLTTLREAEQERVRPNVWEDIKPWMIRWELDHLLAAGTGSNQPRTRFSPPNAPLNQLYHQWNQQRHAGILASDILYGVAKEGGFGSLQEVVSAFEGAYRLIDDPTHGLVATQKRALKAAKEQNPSKFGGMHISEEGVGFGQFMVALLPLVLIGGIAAVIVMSQNMGQAIGLSLALAGLVGVMMIGLSKKV